VRAHCEAALALEANASSNTQKSALIRAAGVIPKSRPTI
jgi:hypothetical protein